MTVHQVRSMKGCDDAGLDSEVAVSDETAIFFPSNSY